MKLTWFGGTALRVYVGGAIVVIDPHTAAAEISQQELVSGADHVVRLADSALERVDPERWVPPRALRAMDDARPVQVASIGMGSCLLHGDGDPALLVSNMGELPAMGRWADSAVMVLFGETGVRVAASIVDRGLIRPRNLLLAAEGEVVEQVIEHVAASGAVAGGMSFAALERGLALEV